MLANCIIFAVVTISASRPPAGSAYTTHRLCSLDGHKLVVALLPADVAEGPVVPGVLGDVADLVD